MKSWKPHKPPFRKYKKEIFAKLGKTADVIYHIGESDDLRKPSKVVALQDIPTPQFQKKITYLKSCMCKYRRLTGMGRGIAGVQVGISEKIAVIYTGSPQVKGVTEIKPADLLIIINPVITKRSKKLLRYPEICMSANPLIAPVVRPAWIAFTYYDEQSKKQEWKTKDDTMEGKIFNRVFQHEIDHMDGIINIDRVQSKELIFEVDPTFYGKAKFEEIRDKSE